MIEKPKFTVIFEILGQKFRTSVPAEDKGEAKAKVRSAIKFLSVEEGVQTKKETRRQPKDQSADLNDIFAIFGDIFKK